MVDGALLLDKAVGSSSNRALQQAKRLFGAAKAGHAGTLDPLASGLLLLLFGEATKFAGPLLDADKEYVATLRLGERTTTGDAEGEVLEKKPLDATEESLLPVLERFRGEIEQVPPMHSALKHQGTPLYRLARRGQEVARAARRVRISSLERVSFDGASLVLRVVCSKGTYIRVLAEDIGRTLGCGAHLSGLRRTASGRFRLEDAVTLEALERMPVAERKQRLLSLPALLEGLPRAELGAAEEARLRQGQALKISGLDAGLCAVVRPDGAVIGLGAADGEGGLKPLRLTQAAEKHLESAAHIKRTHTRE
ncbi:MAG TPA: tRNA pseudouridine(55) synthase TruB [Burkholderiales bacterium]|nr:tRNA pseudouridine(55) synthase TruB [Burkholderiales bacterium]